MEDLDKGEGAQVPEDQEHGDQHPEVPDPVDDERLLPRIRGRLLGVPEPDQEVGAETHPFPAHEQEQIVVRQHQDEHGEGEEVEIGEVPLVPGVVGHVAHAVDVDEEPDPGHHQGHDRGKRIPQKGDVDREVSRDHPGEENLGYRPLVRSQGPEIQERPQPHQERRSHHRTGQIARGLPGHPLDGKAVYQETQKRQEWNDPEKTQHTPTP